ncbi:Non-catalytic module family EXPN protein [Schizophyllum amplum]|uniref:Non-catalytic module family EXPN protein n=1 Tax=Schizophyllum amplum TaxID=97359 RepID=A0A550CTC3_9AGAR|nr:Non-catalytic module family EXPN protein [Auriculariopsis ampla]
MLSKLALFASILAVVSSITQASAGSPSRAVLESRYTRPHSLGDDYVFDPRDGWETVNVTNLQYKYRRDSPMDDSLLSGNGSSVSESLFQELAARDVVLESKRKLSDHITGVGKGITGAVAKVIKTIQAIGKPEAVTITWYTGHDLENPSCWANGNWAPTDASFAAALTLQGWQNKPKCFKFLELCRGKNKCVFVRVVDTCAGCAAGSRHVDLTRAAFGTLADYDEGIATVQMRGATDPEGWFENLWGPKVKG